MCFDVKIQHLIVDAMRAVFFW